ncbi:hypothetical protein GCM10027423_48000 [Spirosoma arcticum]
MTRRGRLLAVMGIRTSSPVDAAVKVTSPFLKDMGNTKINRWAVGSKVMVIRGWECNDTTKVVHMGETTHDARQAER